MEEISEDLIVLAIAFVGEMGGLAFSAEKKIIILMAQFFTKFFNHLFTFHKYICSVATSTKEVWKYDCQHTNFRYKSTIDGLTVLHKFPDHQTSFALPYKFTHIKSLRNIVTIFT